MVESLTKIIVTSALAGLAVAGIAFLGGEGVDYVLAAQGRSHELYLWNNEIRSHVIDNMDILKTYYNAKGSAIIGTLYATSLALNKRFITS